MSKELKNILKARGISQTELARRAGIPKTSICNFVHDRLPVSLKYAQKICAVLGVTVDYLFPNPYKVVETTEVIRVIEKKTP